MIRRAVVAAGTALAALLVIAGSAAAQTGVLSGTVSAGRSNAAIEGATVTIVGTKLSAVTGKDGRFTIADVPAGDHTLRVRRFEFAPREDRIRIAAGDTTRADYELLSPREQEIMNSVSATRERLSLTEPIPHGVSSGRTVTEPSAAHPMESTRSENAPVYILDGVILPANVDIKDIDQASIETVEVIRSKAAIEKYGERAVNGAIIITTKPKPRPPQG